MCIWYALLKSFLDASYVHIWFWTASSHTFEFLYCGLGKSGFLPQLCSQKGPNYVSPLLCMWTRRIWVSFTMLPWSISWTATTPASALQQKLPLRNLSEEVRDEIEIRLVLLASSSVAPRQTKCVGDFWSMWTMLLKFARWRMRLPHYTISTISPILWLRSSPIGHVIATYFMPSRLP